jgi:hypothetical protein
MGEENKNHEQEFEYIDMIVDTEEIENYLYVKLAERGYAPGQSEVQDLADIFFDYLLDKRIIGEIGEEEI